MVLLKIQDPFLAHFAQFIGHGASVNGQKIRQLLTIKGNRKGSASRPHRLFGQIRKQFLPGAPLGHVIYFLSQDPIFLRKYNKIILDQLRMEPAGGGTGHQDPSEIQK